MKKKTTSQIICENFKIPPETIFQDYKCTYKSSVTFFGRLYVGVSHFLFIANMFGLVKKCNIDINLIKSIDYQPNSGCLTIVESNQNDEAIQYIFGSFKNDKAYKLMMALWKGQKLESDVLVKEVDEDIDKFNKFNKEQKVDPALLNNEGHVQANFFNPQTVETQKQKLVQIQIPCSIDQFYDFFLADQATVYSRKKHLELKTARQINVTEWKRSEQLKSDVREITTIIKVTGVPFLKEAGMSQVWMLKRQKKTQNQQLSLNIVTQMADVPYSSYFNCEQHITISPDSDKKCKMVVYASIVFNKSTYMKNKILTRTFSDFKEQYAFWIKNVKSALQQLKKRNQGGSDTQKDKINQIQYEKSEPLAKPQAMNSSQVHNKKQKKQKLSILSTNILDKISLQQKIDIIFIMVFIIMVVNILQFLGSIIF